MQCLLRPSSLGNSSTLRSPYQTSTVFGLDVCFYDLADEAAVHRIRVAMNMNQAASRYSDSFALHGIQSAFRQGPKL